MMTDQQKRRGLETSDERAPQMSKPDAYVDNVRDFRNRHRREHEWMYKGWEMPSISAGLKCVWSAAWFEITHFAQKLRYLNAVIEALWNVAPLLADQSLRIDEGDGLARAAHVYEPVQQVAQPYGVRDKHVVHHCPLVIEEPWPVAKV
jgi:hypothetical protein